jgi:hypothetical protein
MYKKTNNGRQNTKPALYKWNIVENGVKHRCSWSVKVPVSLLAPVVLLIKIQLQIIKEEDRTVTATNEAYSWSSVTNIP